MAALVSLGAIGLTGGFLFARYPRLPAVLVVHFTRSGFPNGFQFKTWSRVFAPVLVQLALATTLSLVCAVLLSRPRGDLQEQAPDVRAAGAAAEAVALLGAIWVVFQCYAAFALARLWQRQVPRLDGYGGAALVGLALTVVVAVRAHRRLGRPEPRPFVPEHWRLGQLYNNRDDPALFVPTRHGARWTLNFGRRVAVLLMAIVLMVGIVGPAVILVLSLR